MTCLYQDSTHAWRRGGSTFRGYFQGYVQLASQSPYPVMVYSVAKDPMLVTYGQM